MRLYKYTDHAAAILGGAFRFGRLRYYQMLEAVDGAWIGDRLDGRTQTNVDYEAHGSVDTSNPLVQRMRGSRMMEVDASSADILVQGGRIYREVDCFVFCWADRQSPKLAGTYSDCVECVAGGVLAHAIWTTGRLKATGQSVQSAFSARTAGHVQYHGKEHNLADAMPPVASALVKRAEFLDQHEYRFILFPRAPIEADFVEIEFALEKSLLRRQPILERVAPGAQQQIRWDKETCVEVLSVAVAEQRKLQDEHQAKRRALALEHGVIRDDDLDARDRYLADVRVLNERYTHEFHRFGEEHREAVSRALFCLRDPASPNPRLDKALARGADANALLSAHEYAAMMRSMGRRT